MEKKPEQRIPEKEKMTPEQNALKNMMLGEAMEHLLKTGLTTADQDFTNTQHGIVRGVLDTHRVKPGPERDRYWRILMRVTEKKFTPEAIAEYELKKKMKGKKYLPLEKEPLSKIIGEAVERISIVLENKKLDADAVIRETGNSTPQELSDKDIRKTRNVITSVLTDILNKNNITNPEAQKAYMKDLRPLVLAAFKNPGEDPAAKILEELYKK